MPRCLWSGARTSRRREGRRAGAPAAPGTRGARRFHSVFPPLTFHDLHPNKPARSLACKKTSAAHEVMQAARGRMAALRAAAGRAAALACQAHKRTAQRARRLWPLLPVSCKRRGRCQRPHRRCPRRLRPHTSRHGAGSITESPKELWQSFQVRAVACKARRRARAFLPRVMAPLRACKHAHVCRMHVVTEPEHCDGMSRALGAAATAAAAAACSSPLLTPIYSAVCCAGPHSS